MHDPVEKNGSDGQTPVGRQEPASEPGTVDETVKPESGDDELDDVESGSMLPYPVVGIGASAGGLEAYIELFSSLAGDTGMAFVVLPHLLADHKSQLVEILARHIPMLVTEIENGGQPQPNRVYILPPGVRASLKDGHFCLGGCRKSG